MINAFDRKRMGDLVVKHMRYQNTTIALSFLALLAVSGCMPVRSSDTDVRPLARLRKVLLAVRDSA